MRQTWLCVALMIVIGLVGCGDDDFPSPNPGHDDGGNGDDDIDASLIDAALIDANGDALDDHDGPTITILEPEVGQLVAGIILLSVQVEDPSGVKPDSVAATIATVDEITMTAGAANRWTGLYDTRRLAGRVFPTIIVRASDNLGNESQLGFEIALDNVAPIVELDPPDIRESQFNSGSLQCSHHFDPVGSDAASDGDKAAQLIELRARIQDLPNTGSTTSNVFVPLGGVYEPSVQLFILDDETRPLVVDTGTDGICDVINPLLVPRTIPMASNEAAVVHMVAIEPSGTSYFASASDGFGGTNSVCSAGTATTPPDQLCPSSDLMTRVTSAPGGEIPTIYSIPPVGDGPCVGYAFDALATNISDGWACAAVRAADGLGNTRVSAPIRICIDADGLNDECGTPPPMPSCTGRYDAATMTTSGTPCDPSAEFERHVIPGEYELNRIN